MYSHRYYDPYLRSQHNIQNDERFIWPLVPFLGGALVGYIAGRPQYNYSYPAYYPIYYPYYNNYPQMPYNYYSSNQ